MPKRRTQVRIREKAVTRREAAAAFGRKKARERKRALRRRWLIGAASALGVMVVCTCIVMALDGSLMQGLRAVGQAMVRGSASAGFAVRQIEVHGRQRVPRAQVEAAIGVTAGDAMVSLPLLAMRERLLAIPEIRQVTIYRRLPDTLTLTLEERKPAARWQWKGKILPIDQEGQVLSGNQPQETASLPLLVGEGANLHVAQALALLASTPSLKPDIAALIRVGGRRWDVRLRQGITIKLPEEQPLRAWQRFSRLVQEEKLLKKALREVDMRLSDRIFLLPADGVKKEVTTLPTRDI